MCEEILFAANFIIAKDVHEPLLKKPQCKFRNLSANCLCRFYGTAFWTW